VERVVLNALVSGDGPALGRLVGGARCASSSIVFGEADPPSPKELLPADLASFILFFDPAHQRDFPKHYDVSVQRKISSDSRIFLTSECFRWIHPSSPEHIGETRIGAERAKLWNEIVYRRVLLEAMLQPAKRFIFFA
jgi:hypothetical protein